MNISHQKNEIIIGEFQVNIILLKNVFLTQIVSLSHSLRMCKL